MKIEGLIILMNSRVIIISVAFIMGSSTNQNGHSASLYYKVYVGQFILSLVIMILMVMPMMILCWVILRR